MIMMDEKIAAGLAERNERIIQSVLKKAETVCPGSVAMVAVAGSFCTGDIHEKSDLDLFIVIHDEAGRKICHCFILGDVAHDIYCCTWDNLERMAEYPDPYVIKLLNVKPVYWDSPESEERYMVLRQKLKDRLASPFGKEDMARVKAQYREALTAYGELMLAVTDGEVRYALAELLYRVEYVLYMLNKSWVHGGVKRIPGEVCGLKRLPEHFADQYFDLIHAPSAEEIKSNAAALLRNVKSLIDRMEEELTTAGEIKSEIFTGVYEEIFSNWKNKMILAAETKDVYLSMMSAASCQALYDELAEEYGIGRVDVMSGFDPENLWANAERFDEAMEEFLRRYQKNACRYASVEEFEAAYLSN